MGAARFYAAALASIRASARLTAVAARAPLCFGVEKGL